MKNLQFSLAVLLATQDVSRNNTPFSAHDVTNRLRDMVNAGEVAFTDRSMEDVDGQTTFRVTHPEVKDIFGQIFQNDLVGSLTPTNTGRYWLYELAQPKSIPTPLPVIACGLSGAPVPTAIAGASFTDSLSTQINAYLQSQGGPRSGVTIKQIQSRFKGVSKTCTEYAAIVEGLGYNLQKNQPDYPSTWYVL